MKEEILLQFLEAGVVNVGSDDAKLEKLREAARELNATLTKAPDQTVCWTLVAADPEISAADPVVAAAWATLKGKWATVANTYQSLPVALMRAIILDALFQVASEHESVAAAFANTARNMLPHMPLGNEADVWQGAVAAMEDLVDKRAEADWTTPDAIKVAPMRYEAPAAIKIGAGLKVTNRDALRPHILAAAGPVAGGNHNPYYIQQNQSAWATEFANRMTVAVADAIDSVAKANAIEPVDLSPALKQLTSGVAAHVDQALRAFEGATAGLQRRTNLLWWKEALYSASTRTSYRQMAPFTAASMMALDLFGQIPTFSPASVSAFLNEAIQLLPGARSEAVGVPEIVRGILADGLTASLRQAAGELAPSHEGRRPVLAILGHGTEGLLGGADVRRATGLGDDVRMRPDEWGAHLFREMQASRAVRAGGAKRSARRG